jgi:hypothetical protein
MKLVFLTSYEFRLKLKMTFVCAHICRSAVWDVEMKMPSGRCELESTGKVSCVPSTVYFTLCNPDLTYWPYDQVNCSLRLGAWMQYGEEINITTVQENVSSDKTGIYHVPVSKHPNVICTLANF